jgi:hypothetical protein
METKTKPHRRRAFDAQTLKEYAELAALRLTDEEICAQMGWNYHSFKTWKCKTKNAPKLANLLVRARCMKLKAHLQNIEEASRGEGPHARADWRASSFLLAIADPARFATSSQAPTTSTTTNNQILVNCGGEDGLKKLIESYSQGVKAIEPAQPMKRLPNPDTPTGSV